uniref:Uncharacterized protein n=1 Tax=Arundo donax TaxID=35708 RepID=A0A0A9G3A3_ARUDO
MRRGGGQREGERSWYL